jgi:hypothetical protein
VLRGHEQQPIGRSNLRLEAQHALRQFAFEVLVVERQIADLDETELRSVRAQPGERMRQLAIDGFAASAADDDRNLDLCHGGHTLVMV